MRQVRTVLMSSSAAHTATETQSTYTVLPAPAEEALIQLNMTALTGGSGPTAIIIVQQGVYTVATADTVDGQPLAGASGITWDDAFSFSVVSTSSITRYLRLTRTTTSAESAASANAMTTNIQRSAYLGDLFRIGWRLTGTSPSATFSVVGKFVI